MMINDWHLWTMAHLGNFIMSRHGEIRAIWHGWTISVISSGKWIYIYCFLWLCCCLFKPFFVFPVVSLLCLSEHLNAAEFPLRTDKVALKSSFNGFRISTWCVHNKINHQALFLLQSPMHGHTSVVWTACKIMPHFSPCAGILSFSTVRFCAAFPLLLHRGAVIVTTHTSPDRPCRNNFTQWLHTFLFDFHFKISMCFFFHSPRTGFIKILRWGENSVCFPQKSKKTKKMQVSQICIIINSI